MFKSTYSTMPQSKIQPDERAPSEEIGFLESAESCNSMNSSKHSTEGDDSLQYLSAEEQACLMFLEKTIESLDTAEPNSLSHDKSPSHSDLGNLAKGNAESRNFDEPVNFSSKDHHRKRTYLVPTPFILANSNKYVPTKPGIVYSGKPPPRINKPSKSNKLHQNSSAIPKENVLVSPPPLKSKTRNDHLSDASSPQPLTCENLIELRQNLSMRATLGLKKPLSKHKNSIDCNDGETAQSQNISENMPSPPAVAPKPKKIPSHIALLQQNTTSSCHADSSAHCLSTSPGDSTGFVSQEKVRLDALTKLGLLKGIPSTTKGPDTPISRLPTSACATAADQDLRTQVEMLTKDELLDRHEAASASQNIVEERNNLGSALSVGRRQSSSAPQVVQKQPQLVPNMGEDRREALRKLGLLKK